MRQDPLQEAQALERVGKTREACTLLEAGLSDAGDRQTALAYRLAHLLMQDGRERRWMAIYQRYPAWSRDGYLSLRYADACFRLDRLATAKRVYTEVIDLGPPRIADSAKTNLGLLEAELGRIKAARAALWRSRALIAVGVFGLAATVGLAWIIGRRDQRSPEE